ncbi:MAG: mechanosensitive ion channel family protein [Deferribacteraceae bacterium]|jgi:small-conductance mechanosensitive channel|nr:mechanosensitive ion channel family protein [Deferribacteraceae bacterium]
MNILDSITLQTVVYNNTVLSYLTALGVFVACWLAIAIIMHITRRLIMRLTAHLGNEIVADIILSERYMRPFFRFVPFYVIVYYLELPAIERFIDKLGIIILGICVVRSLLSVLKAFSRGYVKSKNVNPLIGHTINMVGMIVLCTLGVLFVLSNLGFNVNTLIAGLGIGGMAIALASQTLLADLFNYFTILIDQPFGIGDSISVGGVSGTVDKIGLKCTRVRAAGGELLVISNTDMTKSVLSNFQQMHKRRKTDLLGVSYNTAKATIAEIPSLLEAIVKAVPDTEFVRAHFAAFADSSLNFELVYYVLSADYGRYIMCAEQVNLSILDEFEKRGIGFAYPTQSIYIEKS